jgi:hypothetical protein
MTQRVRRARWVVGSTWDGAPVGDDERAIVDLRIGGDRLEIDVRAPCHGDPPPPGPARSVDGLWAFEVVELFLLGAADRYLEIELSPHGHHLALALDGPRHVTQRLEALGFEARIEGDRWSGRATAPTTWLPAGLACGNAYAIHGVGTARRHLAACPPGGDAPDFHRLHTFPRIPWQDEDDRAPG